MVRISLKPKWPFLSRPRADPLAERIARAAELITASRYTVALTGAGISTPSGIPDFRSPGTGLWEQSDPTEVASLWAFQARPQVFYDWVRPLARLVCQAVPNAAHLALATLEQQRLLKAVITQNIDDLHQKAGSQTVLEVHGSLRDATCLRCYAIVPSESFIQRFLEDGDVPRCPTCGGVLKPNVVFFGEMLPASVFWRAQQAAEECELMVVAGSSLEVAPVSGLPARALDHGARVIIVNQQPTYLDHAADVVFHENVAEVLPRIVAACICPARGWS